MNSPVPGTVLLEVSPDPGKHCQQVSQGLSGLSTTYF